MDSSYAALDGGIGRHHSGGSSDHRKSGNLRGFIALVSVAQACGIALVILVIAWQSKYSTFEWSSKHVFTYHPVMMTLGMVFLYGNGVLVYRVFRGARKLPVKLLHAGLHLSALALAAVGLAAVFKSHADHSKPDMYSVHSWVGLAAVVLFGGQWLLGFLAFLFPKFPEHVRSRMMPVHKALGLIILGMAVAAVISGITEYNMNDGKYTWLEPRALTANFIPVLAIVFVAIVLFIVIWPSYQRVEPELEEESIVLQH